MPQIKAKSLKSQNFPKRKYILGSAMKHKSVNKMIAQRFFSVSELKQNFSHTKGHHGWKNLNQISKVKRAIWEDSTDKRMQKEWERRTNEYTCPNPVTIL